jgi:hypothetical protein
MRNVPKERSLLFLKPKLAKEWDYKKNYPLRPENVFVYSNKKVGWECQKGHKYDAIIANRSNGHDCPCCSGRKTCEDNCLAIINPKLAKEWDYEKNGKLTPYNVTCGSHKKVGWECEKGHKYNAIIKGRSEGRGCPCCDGKMVCEDNCLAMVNPKLAKEWDYKKNGKLTPHDVTPYSNKKVAWECEKGHQYDAIICNRSNDHDCPYCSGQRACKDNCLATLNPKLAKEWHPTKNGKLTPRDITCGSSKEVWWMDKMGHEWQAKVNGRNYGDGCPNCNKFKLKDGSICDSLSEAYYYLKLKNKKIKFKHHVKIGLGACNCDFYIPSINKYIEVTGYSKNWKYWKKYRKGIIRKKNRITKTLKAKFQFVQITLTPKQIQYVRENIA